MSDVLARLSVATYVRAMPAGRERMAIPVISAASRIAVPVADSQLNVKTAASGAAAGTTGGMRKTALSRPAIGILGAEMLLRKVFTCGRPQANTRTLSTTHGRYARELARPAVGFAGAGATPEGSAPTIDPAIELSALGLA